MNVRKDASLQQTIAFVHSAQNEDLLNSPDPPVVCTVDTVIYALEDYNTSHFCNQLVPVCIWSVSDYHLMTNSMLLQCQQSVRKLAESIQTVKMVLGMKIQSEQNMVTFLIILLCSIIIIYTQPDIHS